MSRIHLGTSENGGKEREVSPLSLTVLSLLSPSFYNSTLAGFEKDPTLYFFDLHTFDYDVGDVRGNFTTVEKF